MDKQNVMCTYNEKLFILKKEEGDLYFHMDDPMDIMLNETSQSQEKQILHDSSNIKDRKTVKIIELENKMVVART
jgi:hypothetical protein